MTQNCFGTRTSRRCEIKHQRGGLATPIPKCPRDLALFGFGVALDVVSCVTRLAVVIAGCQAVHAATASPGKTARPEILQTLLVLVHIYPRCLVG